MSKYQQGGHAEKRSLKHIVYLLSVDSKLALSQTTIQTLFWWTIKDPQSRPWYWLRAIMFLTLDIGLLISSLITNTYKQDYIRIFLIAAGPIQCLLLLVSISYFISALRWFASERQRFLKQEEAMRVETPEQASRLFAHLENVHAPSRSRGVILFELSSFIAAYILFMASLFIVYEDPDESNPVALTLGVLSVIDLGMVITSVFGNMLHRLTNNKNLMKCSTIMLCLVFFPIVILSLVVYVFIVSDAQFPDIAEKLGLVETPSAERSLATICSILLSLLYCIALFGTCSMCCLCRVCIPTKVRRKRDALVITNQAASGT